MAYDRIPIGRFSQITRLSRKALRLYDEKGLLVPEVKDLCTGYRYYTGPQIARGVSIKMLCGLGFSPAEIGHLLEARDCRDTGRMGELFGRRRAEIRSEVHRLQQIEAILENGDASLDMIYMSLNEPVIKEVPALRVIGKKGTGPYTETIGRLMEDLCGQLYSDANRKNGVKVAGPFMTLYHDCEYRERDAHMECAAPVSGRIEIADPETEVRTLPGGTFLSLVYRGPYSGLHGAWARIGSFAEQEGYSVTGIHREVYLSDPHEVPENELLTELQVPVGPGGNPDNPASGK